jgi:hypothetical protein
MIRIVGMPGSPYSRKLRAVLRYRRIPYAWIHHGSPEARGLPQPRVPLLPHLIFPGTDEAVTDSTPLIRRLESLHPDRAVVPPDPVMAFLDGSPTRTRCNRRPSASSAPSTARNGSSSRSRTRGSASAGCARRTRRSDPTTAARSTPTSAAPAASASSPEGRRS